MTFKNVNCEITMAISNGNMIAMVVNIMQAENSFLEQLQRYKLRQKKRRKLDEENIYYKH